MSERAIRLEQVRNQANITLDNLLANNFVIMVPCSGLTSILSAGGPAAYLNSPKSFTLTNVSASLLQASNGGAVSVQVTGNGSNLLSSVITIDNLSTTSITSNSGAVISNSTIVLDEVLSFNVITAGANALGLIVKLSGYTTEAVGT